jgi:hypothetical protein
MSAHLKSLPPEDRPARATIVGPVAKPANVRLATMRDEPAILDLLLEDLAENATAVAPPSISAIMRNVEMGTRSRGGFTGVIDGIAGPVAVAILIPTTWWWSDSVYLQEVVLYVTPSARKRHAGADLLRWECWLADQMTATAGHQVFVLAGVTATHRREAKERLYERHMNRVGAFMIYPAIGGLSL